MPRSKPKAPGTLNESEIDQMANKAQLKEVSTSAAGVKAISLKMPSSMLADLDELLSSMPWTNRSAYIKQAIINQIKIDRAE